jgi:uncharacterized membrane protein YfcA
MRAVLGTVFESTPQLALAAGVVLLAQAVYVLFGFGSGLIVVAGLTLIGVDLRDAVVLVLLINVPAEIQVVTRSHREIEWRGVLWIALGVAVGVPCGAAVLRFGDPAILLTLLGAVLVAIGFAFLRRDRATPRPWVRGWALPAGVVSGALTGLFGTGGPPLIVYYRLAGAAKAAFRGNLMALFLLMTLVRVPAYAIAGLITAPRLWSGLAVLPAVALGTWAGHRIHVDLSEDTFRRAVAVALLVLGVVLLIRGTP